MDALQSLAKRHNVEGRVVADLGQQFGRLSQRDQRTHVVQHIDAVGG